MMKGRDSSSQLLDPTWWPLPEQMINLCPRGFENHCDSHDPAAKPLREIPISHRFHP